MSQTLLFMERNQVKLRPPDQDGAVRVSISWLVDGGSFISVRRHGDRPASSWVVSPWRRETKNQIKFAEIHLTVFPQLKLIQSTFNEI